MSTDKTAAEEASSLREQRQIDDYDRIRQSLRGLQFGSISVIVQDGIIVQIDRTEKTRIRRTKPVTFDADGSDRRLH